MSYTPATGDNVVLNFDGVYTPPSGDSLLLEFTPSFFGTGQQAALLSTGHAATLAVGFTATAGIATLSLNGLPATTSVASFWGQALAGSLSVSGFVSNVSCGFNGAALCHDLQLEGDTSSVSSGFKGTAVALDNHFIGLSANCSYYSFQGMAIQKALALTGLDINLHTGFNADCTPANLSQNGQEPNFSNRLYYEIYEDWVATRYECFLGDLELPIGSFQTRLSSASTYLSIVMNGVDAYVDEITERLTERLIVYRIYEYLDGSTSRFKMVDAPFETLQTNLGGRSGMTGNLSGAETTKFVTPQTLTLYDPITRSSDAGGRRYRCRIDPRARPGDTVTINNETFVVDGITHIIDSKTAIMDITEKSVA
jgi:hypothetical protein